MSEVPKHWRIATLGDVCKINYGNELSRNKFTEEGYPVFGANGVIGRYSDYMFPNPKVLISCRGAYSGKINLSPPECFVTNNSLVLEPKANTVTKEYLYYALQSVDKSRIRSGSAQAQVTISSAEDLEFPVAPLPEQRRIVAKIEELFSNLDAGRDELAVAEQQLERYRLSVLQAAVEGRLTADWRRAHDPEPADQLLERILEERRKQWEEQYRWERYDSKDKEPPSGWKKRYKEPVVLENVEDLTSLPGGWEWISLHHLCRWSNGDGLPKKARKEGPYPVYGGNGVTGSHSEYMLRSSAVVVGCVGAHCGNVHLAPPESWITDNAIYSKWKSSLVDEQFLLLQLQIKGLNQLAGGSGQPYISQKVLKSLPVVLIPLAEQKQIVAEVERLLSVAEDAATTTQDEQTRAERLRQSILKQAFSGTLVPHEAGHSTVAPSTDTAMP